MSVLAPDSECRIFRSAFGSTAIGVASRPSPYRTAGTRPAFRVRRASFLPNVSRAVASSITSILFPPLRAALDEQRRYRCFLVNALDRLAEQAGHREHHDL